MNLVKRLYFVLVATVPIQFFYSKYTNYITFRFFALNSIIALYFVGINDRKIVLDKKTKLATLFVVYSLMLSLVPVNVYYSFVKFMTLITAFLMYFVTINIIKTRNNLIYLLKFTLVITFIISIVSIIFSLLKFMGFYTYSDNILSSLLNMDVVLNTAFSFLLLPIAIAFSLYYKNKLSPIYSFIVFVAIISVFISTWRSAILSLSIMLLLIILVNRKKFFKVENVLAVVFVILLIVLIPSFNNIVKELPFVKKTEAKIDITGGRANLWLTALNIYSKHPFLGVGPGNFPIYYYEEARDLTVTLFGREVTLWVISSDIRRRVHLHNLILSLLVEYGIIGFLLFGGILFLCLKNITKAIKMYKNKNDIFMYNLSFSVLIGLVGLLIIGQFSSAGFEDSIYVWSFFALTTVVKRIAISEA